MAEETNAKRERSPFCPSAQPDLEAGLVFGVVGGTVDEPLVGYLERPQRVTEEILESSKPAKPTEVFRLAAPCAGAGCQHFDGSRCRLVQRAVEHLPEVVDELPPCHIRAVCRWWMEEGKAACLRCPQVTTVMHDPSEEQCIVADPGTGS